MGNVISTSMELRLERLWGTRKRWEEEGGQWGELMRGDDWGSVIRQVQDSPADLCSRVLPGKPYMSWPWGKGLAEWF